MQSKKKKEEEIMLINIFASCRDLQEFQVTCQRDMRFMGDECAQVQGMTEYFHKP